MGMRTGKGIWGLAGVLALGAILLVLGNPAWSQGPMGTPPAGEMGREQPFSPQPPYRVADRSTNTPDGGVPEHPLMPALRWAKSGLPTLEQIQDYSAVLIKREQVGGKVRDPATMFIKIRHRPFSVYVHFLAPASVKGTESIWVEGQNNGKMWAHGPGLHNKLWGTLSLDPRGPIAMYENRYPITEIGLLNLIRKLIEHGEHDVQYGECEVKFIEGAKVNNHVCTCVQVVHPVPRRTFRFHLARIFVDNQTGFPIRYEAYDWPSTPGGPPELIEEYTYLDLKINNGFTDADFDIRNPNYQFREGQQR